LAVGRHTRDERLELHPGDGGFLPLHLAVDHLPLERPVPPCLELAEVLLFLYVDLRQPLHIGDAVPAGHDQAKRRTLMACERLTVERIGQERLAGKSLLAIQAASELLLHLEGLATELDVLFALVGSEEHKLAGLSLDSSLVENRLEWQPRPASVAREALQGA